MSDIKPLPSESDPAPANPPPPQRFFRTDQAEIGCGAALSALPPALVVLVTAWAQSGQKGANGWQEAGIVMFLWVIPTAVVATIVAIIPRSRLFGQGMLVGTGVLLLLSLLTCSIR